MDLLFPLPARISTCTTSIISNTALSRSIFSGASRSLARAGDRFGFDIKIAAASDTAAVPLRAMLRNLSAGVRGQANRLWLADPSYSPRGSFPTGELLGNGNFAQGTAGWTPNVLAFSVADGYARLQNSTASVGFIFNQNAVSLVSGAAYVARALVYPGNQATWIINGGTTGGSTTYFALDPITVQGLYAQSFVASAANFFLTLATGTNAIGDFVHYLYASLSQCAIVNGASQTGPNLNIEGLPNGLGALLLPGDRVQIGTQLNTIVAPVYSNGSGLGYMQCALPWRASPANGAAVIIFNPMARCILTSNTSSWDESPGKMADFEFTLEESLDL